MNLQKRSGITANQKKIRGVFLFLVMFMMCLAAPYRLSSAAELLKAEKITFTDNSGKYLLKSGNDWFLKDRNGKNLTSIQYVKTGNKGGFTNGFYVFGKNGNLLQKKAVYRYQNRKINGVVFNGWYYASDGTGKLCTNPGGLMYIEKHYSSGKLFWGWYYVGSYGKLTDKAQVRYLPKRTAKGQTFYKGYYYCYSDGRVGVEGGFHKCTGTVNGRKLDGEYFFMQNQHGKMYEKGGWITWNGQKYALEQNIGKKLTNTWKDGYYLLSDGTIARNTRVPDGSYVGPDGKKYPEEEVALLPLKNTLSRMTAGYPGIWSVYVKNLKTGDVVRLNDDLPMYPASTIKLFNMASIFDQINRKNLSYSSVKSLLWYMITESDNDSYNRLVPMNSPSRTWSAGSKVLNQYLTANGYTRTGAHHTVHPSSIGRQSDGGGDNRSCARDCGLLLENIYMGRCVSPTYSGEMLNMLLHQQRRYKIPAGVPAGIRVANKTGETGACQHDAAIIYGTKATYVLTVFSSGVSEEGGISGIRNISRTVYQYLN